MKKKNITRLSSEEACLPDLVGNWTFAHSKEKEWINESFETKDQAIEAGKDVHPCGFLIGQFTEDKAVINIEKLTFS